MASFPGPSEATKAQSLSVEEPIPTYTEATTTSTSSPSFAPPPPVTPQPAPADEPPAYAFLDEAQTSFSIHGTFIHNASGPVYQLSSPLDARGTYFRLRRLRAKEAQQAGSTPIAFDKSYILYEASDYPLLYHEYHIIGKRRQCLPGVLEFVLKRNKWRVTHIPRPGMKGKEILTCKKGGALGSSRINWKKEAEASQWKDERGRVVATEMLKEGEGGQWVPTVELSEDLDQTWREMVIMMWATRLWVAFGTERSALEGG
jgi:hypothetical protein